MPLSTALGEVLQQLSAAGYQFADARIAAMPDESIQASDWRLDALHRVISGVDQDQKVLVIAVSSRQRKLKLLFVEVVDPHTDFSPMTLMRRLFPAKRAQASRQRA